MPKPDKLEVCMLSAEVRPYSTVGGLSDVVAALPAALIELGVEVRVLSPLYRQVRAFRTSGRRAGGLKKLADLKVPLPGRVHESAIYIDPGEKPTRNYFIEQDEYFDREGIYNEESTGVGYPDNFERFNFFMVAALEALARLEWKPHVLHCHDSQTALLPAYLKLARMADPFYKDLSTVLTIHNLAYQGVFSADKYRQTGLPHELFYGTGPFEYYGLLNMMKAGICYADVLNTVSQQYAKEIQTKEYGSGLESVLERRKTDLYGILNGIDTKVWDPQTDPLIFANYSAQKMAGKKTNKRELQKLCGLSTEDVPIVGMISRLADQKGFDLLLELKKELAAMNCQWVILGTGMKSYQDALEELAREYPDKFAVYIQFDTELSHRIEAGSDMFLMPSRYEPCGLNQMYSMRYGTIPVVRNTGGLADTVEEFDSQNGKGTGFKFFEANARELLKALKRAIDTYQDRALWRKIMQNAMAQDFSWEKSAREYVRLYEKAIAHR
ncbi:MAG: glycogen synthase GlgA [Acidobacteriota bacterium]